MADQYNNAYAAQHNIQAAYIEFVEWATVDKEHIAPYQPLELTIVLPDVIQPDFPDVVQPNFMPYVEQVQVVQLQDVPVQHSNHLAVAVVVAFCLVLGKI
jgi:hypothetical protein